METIKRPVFKKPDPDDFYKKLRQEVSQVLENPKYQRLGIAKAIGLLLLYIALYTGILLFGNHTILLFLFYILTGFAMITLFINTFHDAVHHSVFKTKRYNRWFTGILEIFGSNTWLWTKRHITLHHAYTSVQDWDIDIRQSDIIRLFPNSPLFDYHKYQHLYMWLIYPLYTLNWILIRDFKDFYGSKDNYVRRIAKIPVTEHFKLFSFKLLSFFLLLGVPMLVLNQPWSTVLLAWLCMHIFGSMLGVIALISTHVDEHAEFAIAGPDGKLNCTWAEHQMQTTKDFSTSNPLANFLYGGFTHHVAHHLFPEVSHTYYPAITPIIRKYADRYNLPYTCYPFYEAVRSHYRLLKQSGRTPNLLRTGEL